MPFYNDLRPKSDYETRDYALVFPNMSDVEKHRTISNLLRLKAGLDKQIPSRKVDQNLLIASWNIKEFGHTTQRLSEAYFYIAEIIARFDLVAVQEVKSTLKDLNIVMRILGSDWDYLINDITDGQDGNSERSAYLFNKKSLRLSGLAGELVLWPDITEDSAIKQLKRTPFMTGFKSGWKTFIMLNLHLHPGKNQTTDDDDVAFRKEELRLLLAALEYKKGKLWSQNLILAGDMNLYEGVDDSTVDLINEAGYYEVDGLMGKDTNASQTQTYDRMFITNNDYFQVAKDSDGKGIGDVFNPFEFVYLQEDSLQYKQNMIDVYGGSKDIENDIDELDKYFMFYWRRNQISDHFPIWFELNIDSSDLFLKSKLNKLTQEL